MGILYKCGTFIVMMSVTIFSRYAFNKYYKKKAIRKQINEVIMFSTDSPQLRKSKYSRCMITQSMERILFFLHSPRKTLDICMYVLTNTDIANAIMKCHYRGVQIRVIIDADLAFATGSHRARLEKHGIPVRWMKSTNLMHHKFCLIDSESLDDQGTPLVMMGSLNWTNQALNGNWEDVAVTSQSELVEQYRIEFERLWLKFKPVVGK